MKLSPLSIAPLLVFAACSKTSAPATPDGGVLQYAPTPTSPPPPSASTSASAPSASASASAKPAAVEENDFEDQFAYGEYDAGTGDPATLAKKPGYDPYANPRFGFTLDVPKALTAMPEPENGDGLQWRLGNLIAITASGMNWMPEIGLSCASSKNVTGHEATKTSCWATGKRDGMIYWEKEAVSRDTLFSLRFEYAESLKTQMDPIVKHVNASWKF